MGRVWLTPAFIVEAEQEDDTPALRATLTEAGLKVTPGSAGLLIEGDTGISAAALERAIAAALTAAGKSPQLRAAPEALASDERAEGIERTA